MNLFKKILMLSVAVVAVLSVSVTAFASHGYSRISPIKTAITTTTTPLTLEQHKAESLERVKASLAAQVKNGSITQTRADEVLAAFVANQALCDGTGANCTGANGTCVAGGGAGCAAGYGTGTGTGTGTGCGGGCRR